ncbi:MAG TPA: response regulator [Nitrospirota bacterium]|nr:response regulator [Nitrospirota bacterium]
MNHKILIIDDEPDIVDLVSYNLKKDGFRVMTASDGEEALNKIQKDKFDLVVLDLMLPNIQGGELCRIMKNDPRTAGIPIIMLTAKGEEGDRVMGLENGADDYITKPFSVRELIARIKAVLRRAGEKAATQKIMRIGKLSINTETYGVTKDTTPLELSATEFKLLVYLAQRKGKVFSREQLVDAVWKGEAFIEPRTVDVHIRRLRTQIEDDPSNPTYLKTRRGVGYYVDAAQ